MGGLLSQSAMTGGRLALLQGHRREDAHISTDACLCKSTFIAYSKYAVCTYIEVYVKLVIILEKVFGTCSYL